MLSKSLKTDLSDLGALLQAHGRGKDRVLAHITPKEAALLKARGGRGSRNPKTGLLEFDDTGIENVTVTAPYLQPDISGVASSTYTKPAQQVQPNVTPPTASDVKSSVDQSVLTSPLPATNDTPAVPSDGQTGFTVPDQQVTPTVNVPGVEQATVTGLRQMPDIAPLLPVDAAAATGGSDNKPTGNTATSFGDKVTNYLTNPTHLLELGGLGALGYLGISNSNKAGTQAQAQQQQLGALAQPFQQVGQQALDAATSGNLTPQNAKALEAARAQIGQSMASGGVSAEQGAEKISTVFASLLQDQLNQAVQLLQTANDYTQAAINAGYQTTQQGQTATANFFQNLAATAAKVL